MLEANWNLSPKLISLSTKFIFTSPKTKIHILKMNWNYWLNLRYFSFVGWGWGIIVLIIIYYFRKQSI